MQRVASKFPLEAWGGHGILLAVSGGADSVALLRLFCEFRDSYGPKSLRIAVAHVNHALRGAESDADAEFVRELSEWLSVPYFETRLNSNSGWSEDEARKGRYEFLEKTANSQALRHLALAHHADDRIETILHRIIRGTGILGLGGIPFSRKLSDSLTIIRPLLQFHNEEILEYLESIGQEFRTDSSNLENSYTRNRIRNELLPYISKDYNPGFGDSLLRLGDQAAELREIFEEKLETLYEKSVRLESDGTVTVSIETLKKEPRYLVRECFVKIWSEKTWPLQGMGFVQWDLLADAVINHEMPPQTDFPGAIRIERRDKRLRLFSLPEREHRD